MRESTRERALAVALVFVSLLALAGCSAISDGQTRSAFDVDESEYTARAALANGSIIAFDSDRDLAPKPDLLVETTMSRLANQSHTVLGTFTAETDDGEPIERAEMKLEHAQNASVYTQQLTVVTQTERWNESQYSNGETVWGRTSKNGSTSVSLIRNGIGEPVLPAFERIEPVERRILTGMYGTNRTSVTEVPASDWDVGGSVYRLKRAGPTHDQTRFENESVRMVVTGDGYILAYEYDASYRNRSGTLVHLHTTIEIVDVGRTDVEPPDWLPANATEDRRGASPTPGISLHAEERTATMSHDSTTKTTRSPHSAPAQR
jgi:hypothetical protein